MEKIFSPLILYNLTIPNELENLVRRHFVQNSIHSGSTETIFILLYSLLGCLGITVNLIVITVILTTKKLRNSENSLIVNLCCADILLCLWSIPFTLYQILRRDWSLGQLMCSTVPFLQATIVFVIAQTITVIAFDRLSAITGGQQSFKRKQWSTLSKGRFQSYGGGGSLSLSSSIAFCPQVTKRIPLIWISSILLGSPLVYFYKEVSFNFNGIPLYNRCIEHWSQQIKIIYSSITFIISLVIPIICLIASQIKIVSFLNRQGNIDIRPTLVSRATISSTTARSVSAVEPIEMVKQPDENNNDLPQPHGVQPDEDKGQLTSDPSEVNQTSNRISMNGSKSSSMNTSNDTMNSNISSPINTASPGGNIPQGTNSELKSSKFTLNSLIFRAPPKAFARYSVTLRPIRFILERKGNRNRRAILSLYRVSVTFVLSWLPLNLVNLYLDLIDPPSISGAKVYIILGVCHLIAISSSVTNAIFYGLMNTNIKRELSKIRRKRNDKSNQPNANANNNGTQ